jgi:hypothetical protein
MIGYEQNDHLHCLLVALILCCLWKILTTSTMLIITLVLKPDEKDVTMDNNTVVHLDVDSTTNDDHYSDNGFDGEEDDVDKADNKEEEEQEERIEENGEVDDIMLE